VIAVIRPATHPRSRPVGSALGLDAPPLYNTLAQSSPSLRLSTARWKAA